MMTLVSTITVGSGGAASIEFTGIPQDGKDLQILFSPRTNKNATTQGIVISINGSTSDFTRMRLLGDGSSASSSTVGDSFAGQYSAGALATANTFGNASIYISNYALTQNKSISIDGAGEDNATLAFQEIIALTLENTSAVTSLALLPNTADNFVQHSTASLYIIS